jgi:hypothetical protein
MAEHGSPNHSEPANPSRDPSFWLRLRAVSELVGLQEARYKIQDATSIGIKGLLPARIELATFRL